MRPQHLKSPFSSRDRQVLIHDRILYVPPRCSSNDFIFPGWRHSSIFKNEAPIKIEYCSGNGAWIAEKAASDPHSNWVAVEMEFERVRKIWAKRENHHLDNLFIICGEAAHTTATYMVDNFVSEVFINFPDPWPKRRHAPYRLIQPQFIKEISRILIDGSLFTLVTDDPPYSHQFIETMNAFPDFCSNFPDPYFMTDYPGYGNSYFEDIWRTQGKEIRYHQYRKQQ